jgi:hypothetical protein
VRHLRWDLPLPQSKSSLRLACTFWRLLEAS